MPQGLSIFLSYYTYYRVSKRDDTDQNTPALNKNQLDATYYFIVLLIGSTCFGHYYAHHQVAACSPGTTPA